MVRLLAQQLQGKLGQAVVVDNKPGDGTTIGSKAAAVAHPDGYTLLFASSALVVEPILNKQIEYDPEKDFTPIAFIARNSCLFAINAQGARQFGQSWASPSIPKRSRPRSTASGRSRLTRSECGGG